VIAKAVSRCPGRLKLFDVAKMSGAHTHMAASSSFSYLSIAGSGDVTRDKLTVGVEFHTAHCGLSDRRGWPDGAALQTVVCPV